MKRDTYTALYDAGAIGQSTVPLTDYEKTEKERQYSKISGTEKGIIYDEIKDINETSLFLQAKKVLYLKSIKNSMLFFVALTILNLICLFVIMSALK